MFELIDIKKALLIERAKNEALVSELAEAKEMINELTEAAIELAAIITEAGNDG